MLKLHGEVRAILSIAELGIPSQNRGKMAISAILRKIAFQADCRGFESRLPLQ
jgi:hypothetical protein